MNDTLDDQGQGKPSVKEAECSVAPSGGVDEDVGSSAEEENERELGSHEDTKSVGKDAANLSSDRLVAGIDVRLGLFKQGIGHHPLNVVLKDRIVESQHEDLGNDVASDDQRLQAERNREPSQGLVMVIRERRSHHEVAVEPALHFGSRIGLSYGLTGTLHREKCIKVADCGQSKHQSPVAVRNPSTGKDSLEEGAR